MTVQLLPPLYDWHRWPRDYEPSNEQLEAMSDEEYDAYAEEFERWLAVTELEEVYGNGAIREYALTCFTVV